MRGSNSRSAWRPRIREALRTLVRIAPRALLALALVEVTSCAAHLVLYHRAFSWRETRGTQRSVAGQRTSDGDTGDHVSATNQTMMIGIGMCVHPYLGFGFDPSATARPPEGFAL